MACVPLGLDVRADVGCVDFRGFSYVANWLFGVLFDVLGVAWVDEVDFEVSIF